MGVFRRGGGRGDLTDVGELGGECARESEGGGGESEGGED